MLPRPVRLARTDGIVLQRMRASANALPGRAKRLLLNHIIDLFQQDQSLYWVKISSVETNPEDFIQALSAQFTETEIPSTRQIARAIYLYAKKGGNRIIFERVNDPALGLDPDSRTNLLWKAADDISKKILEVRAVPPAPVLAPAPVLPPAVTAKTKLLADLKDPADDKRKAAWMFIENFLRRLSYPEQINFIRKFNQIDGDRAHPDSFFKDEKEVVDRRVLDLVNPANQDYKVHLQPLIKAQAVFHDLKISENEAFAAASEIREQASKDQKQITAKEHLKGALNQVYRLIKNAITADDKSFNAAEWTLLLDQMFTVPTEDEYLAAIPSVHAGRSIANQPIKTVQIEDTTNKWGLFEEGVSFDMSAARAVEPKGRGGANYPGADGAVFEWVYEQDDAHGNFILRKQTMFFKQPTDADKINYREIIAEVTGAIIMHAIAPLNTAAVSYAVRANKTHGGKDQDVGVLSLYYDDFYDINRLRTYPNPEEPRSNFKNLIFNQQTQDTFRGLCYGNFAATRIPALNNHDPLYTVNYPVRGLGRCIGKNWLVNQRQFHISNLAIARVGDHFEFVDIDYGASLRRNFKDGKEIKRKPGEAGDIGFSRSIHPHTVKGAKHFLSYIKAIPRDVRMSQGFINELTEIAYADRDSLVGGIDKALAEAKRNFTLPMFRQHFAAELGIDEQVLVNAANNYDELVRVVKNFMVDRVLARQFSLREYILELKISGWIEPQKFAAFPDRPPHDDASIEASVKKNPFYFLRKRFHFRGEGQGNLAKNLRDAFEVKVTQALNAAGDGIHNFLSKDLNFIRFPDVSGVSKEEKLILESSKIKNSMVLMRARVEFLQTIFAELQFNPGVDDAAKQRLQNNLRFISERLAFALQPKQYDFSNEDDLGIALQMCDEAYGHLDETLRALNDPAPVLTLMTIPGSTELQGAQLEYLQKVVSLTKYAKSQVAAVPALVPNITASKAAAEENSFCKALVDEILGTDRSHAHSRDDAKQVQEDAYATFKEIRANLSLKEQKDLIVTIHRLFPGILEDNQLQALVTAYDKYVPNVKHHRNKEALKDIIKTLYATLDSELRKCQTEDYAGEWREVITQLLTVPERDPAHPIPIKVQGRNLAALNIHIPETPLSEHPSCLALRPHLTRNMAHCRWLGTKVGGARGKGTPYGGWYLTFYRNENGKICSHRMLCKQDDSVRNKLTKKINHQQNVGEVVASYIGNAVGGDTSASVILATCPQDPSIQGDDRFYICSIAFPNFTPSFKRALQAMGVAEEDIQEEHAKLLAFNPTEASRKFEPGIIELMKQGKLKNLAIALAVGLLLDNRDMHGDNTGESKARKGEDGQYKILDHGAATHLLSRSVHPRKSGWRDIKSVLAHEPTNHFLDYPVEFIVTPSMAEGLYAVATSSREELVKGVELGLAEARFSAEALKEYAAWAGIKLTGVEDEVTIVETLKTELIKTHVARQYSLKEFSLEIKLKCCFKSGILFAPPAEWASPNSEKEFAELVKQNPTYFLRGGHKGYHLRGLGLTEKLIEKLSDTYKNFIYQHAVKVLRSNENQTGIREFLLQDFNVYSNFDDKKKTDKVAELLIMRLDLFLQLMSDSPEKEKLRTVLDDLQEAYKYFNKSAAETPFDTDKDDKKKLLIQVCDTAYQAMANTYDLMPESSNKVMIYEIFNKIKYKNANGMRVVRAREEQHEELENASTHRNDYIATNAITLSDSKAIGQLEEEVARQESNLGKATSSEEVAVIQNRLQAASNKIEAIASDVPDDQEEKLQLLRATVAAVTERASTESAVIESEKQKVLATSTPDAEVIIEPTYATKKTATQEILKPISIEQRFLTQTSNVLTAAYAQFEQAAPRQSLLANLQVSAVKANRVVEFVAATKAAFYHDPTDEANYLDPNKPSSGLVVSRQFEKKAGEMPVESQVTAHEYKTKNMHRLTYRIAQNLLTMANAEGVAKGRPLLKLKHSSGNEGADVEITEQIVLQCFAKSGIDPLTFSSGKLTPEVAGKFLDLLKKRDEFTFTSGEGFFRSKLANPENMYKLLIKSTTSYEHGYPNLEPPELMAYAKVWATRFANVLKHKDVLNGGGHFHKKPIYDPRKLSFTGSTDLNFPLIRSILLATAATYDFNAKMLKQIYLGPAIKKHIHIIDHESRQSSEVARDALLITDDDIRDAKAAYQVENNKLHAVIEEQNVHLPIVDRESPAVK